jgi:hypothetical protein
MSIHTPDRDNKTPKTEQIKIPNLLNLAQAIKLPPHVHKAITKYQPGMSKSVQDLRMQQSHYDSFKGIVATLNGRMSKDRYHAVYQVREYTHYIKKNCRRPNHTN